MWGSAKTQGWVFGLFLAGDWLATVGIRLIAEQSQWAVMLSALSAVLWVWGVRSVNKPRTAIAAVLGVVCGTELGILWP